MSAPDQSTTTPTVSTALSTPISGSGTGAGSADLATESTDPQELRALLDRARERLSYYESFDRIISEHVLRTGEMMAETVALREQAAQAIRERQAVDEALQADRERYRALIEGALDEVRTARPVLESMLARLQGALDELSRDAIPVEPEAAPELEPDVAEPSPAPVESEFSSAPGSEEQDSAPDPVAEFPEEAAIVEETRPEEDLPEDTPANDEPVAVDVLAHGVPSADIAIGLQNLLRGLDEVTKVEAREFADGELRLHVACTGTISDAPLTDWLQSHNGILTSRNGKAIELTFS
jgi:hypothetical protein